MVLALSLFWAAPASAFTPDECTENYIADGLPIDARAETFPDYFVEPGQLGGDLICTLIPSDAFGPIIQVSEPIPDSPHAAFVQYFPDSVQILRTEGQSAGLSLSICGPIRDDLPPDQNPGGFWCRIDLAIGLGVTFDLEYDRAGTLSWLNFEVSTRPEGILADSTLAPVLPETAAEDLRAGVILSGGEVTHLLRYAQAANVLRMQEPGAILDLFFALREAPQDMTIVLETGEPDTGPFAQADIPAEMVAHMLAELDVLEGVIRGHRGL